MAVTKKIQEAVKDAIEFGIDQALPPFMLFIVHAWVKAKGIGGYAIVGAGSKAEAKRLVYKQGWLHLATVKKVESFYEYCGKWNSDIMYQDLKESGRLPKRVGE